MIPTQFASVIPFLYDNPDLANTFTTCCSGISKIILAPPIILKKSISNLKKVGFSKIDYLKICDNLTLEELDSSRKHARLFAAVWLGKTRLTDNMMI